MHGEVPSFVDNLSTKEGIYTEKQINKILVKDEWSKFDSNKR